MVKRGQSYFAPVLFLLGLGCATLSQGERLYRSRCSACHMLIPPHEYSMEGWTYALDRYGKNLSGAEKEEIIRYLLQHGVLQ